MFKQENSLPCAECHFAVLNRDGLAGAGERHPNVAGHVIRAFQRVDKPRCVLGHEFLEKHFEVAAGRGIRVFHDDQTGTGVAHEHAHDAIANAGFFDGLLHFAGDFQCSLASGANADGGMVDHEFQFRVGNNETVETYEKRKS